MSTPDALSTRLAAEHDAATLAAALIERLRVDGRTDIATAVEAALVDVLREAASRQAGPIDPDPH